MALASTSWPLSPLGGRLDGKPPRFLAEAADDDANAGDDDAVAGDDAAAAGDDAVADDDGNNVTAFSGQMGDDDLYDLSSLSFGEVSVMPVSCLSYNNGWVIKFEFFENSANYQCHFKNLGTFVVSIAHYMRAYFNYQALANGRNFQLPGDAGFLNCVLLQETAYADQKLYAKIGCMERETFTSTKLQLHVYTDNQCSVAFDDGQTKRQHVGRGYDINGYSFGTKVSFRPPFYTCQTCNPEAVSDTFRRSSYWYDDDYISEYGERRQNDDDGGGGNDDAQDANAAANDDANGGGGGDDDNYYRNDDANDDGAANYYQANDDLNDDAYYAGDDGGGGGNGNDDANAGGDDDGNDDANAGDDAVQGDDGGNDDGNGRSYWYWKGGNNGNKGGDDDDDYFTADDDRRRLESNAAREDDGLLTLTAAPGQLERFEADFWREVGLLGLVTPEGEAGARRLEDGEADADAEEGEEIDDDQVRIENWNMCERIYKYGLWCDEDCRALDTFRVDEWSSSDVFLLVVMCLFIAAMMLLVFAKRVKAYEKASVYGDEIDAPYPGLPPMAMVMLFILIMTVILVLSSLKFVNETLVFAVVTCILLFIYMLKLTLFESKRTPLLPTARHRNYQFD